MSALKRWWAWLDSHVGFLFLGGLTVLAMWNWGKWRQDRLLARRLQDRKPEPVNLKAKPKVSVLVAAWNEARIVSEHIASFLQLRYPDTELILCAGGRDGTHEIARHYSGERVIVLEQQQGEGKQQALRQCLEHARGELIFLTDADCLLNAEAFERTVAPIVNGTELVATGQSRPLSRQRTHPFVLHRWFIEVYGVARWGRYADGILGRNAALRRDVLETIGGFDTDVRTGTDYHLAKQVLSRGYSIHHVPDSAVETPYAETFKEYQRQQDRWFRNVVLHGLRFGAYDEVLRCLIPSILGTVMLTGPLLALCLGRVVCIGWLLVWLHVFFSRLRYVRFGAQATGCSFPTASYIRLPGYILADFIIWASTLIQYPFKSRRSQW